MDRKREIGAKPRMTDVARHAGVALGTVSNAVNHPHRVHPATLARVRDAIDSLGFVPDRRASALAAGTSNTVGFVIVDLGNTLFLDMARGAERVANERGMNVLLANADIQVNKQGTYLDLFEQERVAGLLVAPVPGTDEELLAVATRRSLVTLNHCLGKAACCVTVDEELGGYLAARHLIETGRRRLLSARGPAHLDPLTRRWRGLMKAVEETNGAVTIDVVEVSEVQVRDGREVGNYVAGLPKEAVPDGIVAPADLLAWGIEQVLLTQTALRIPEDVALIGYDNNRAAWDSAIPISTIAQPGEEMGSAAMRLLLDELTAVPGGHQHRHEVLEPRLIERASTRH